MQYAEDGYDCDGNCLNDADGDGVCDEFEVAGCQERPLATTTRMLRQRHSLGTLRKLPIVRQLPE